MLRLSVNGSAPPTGALVSDATSARVPLTHASFFSGVGGLDLGLENAGWTTVSFSEIDPYASAVLAERWPGVPNLGDIGGVVASERLEGPRSTRRPSGGVAGNDWRTATLWSGGFPCQDLSVAGKRRGLAGERSGLAFAFLALVERHRPSWVLLENVPGLFSSHRGKDLGALLGALGDLGYGWAYRVLDARYFGVAQRRRRVFIVGGPDADSAGQVLFESEGCGGHPAEGDEAREGTSGVLADGARTTRTVQSAFGHHGWTLGAQDGGYLQLGPPPHAGRVRAPDGLAGRLDDRRELVQSLDAKGGGPDDNEAQAGHLVAFAENQRGEVRDLGGVMNPLTGGGGKPGQGYPAVMAATEQADDALLPPGLDSHRYRCCGNGVVAPVAEWIGRRLREVIEHE